MSSEIGLKFIADTIEPLGFVRFDAIGNRTQFAWRKLPTKAKPSDVRVYAMFRSELKIEIELYRGSYPQTRGHVEEQLELDLNDPMSHDQLLAIMGDLDEF